MPVMLASGKIRASSTLERPVAQPRSTTFLTGAPACTALAPVTELYLLSAAHHASQAA